MEELEPDISEKQMKILAFPYSKYDVLIADGAIRTGKTTFIIISLVEYAMKNFNHQNFAICAKTIHSAIRNIVNPLKEIDYIKRRYNIKLKLSSNVMIISRGKIENTFYIFGGKDESSYSLIQGITLASAMLDEVALMPKSFVEQAIARCSIEKSKIFFNCNPASPTHWFYTDFVLKTKEKSILYLHFDIDDNPYLSETIKQRYKNMYTGVFYDRYIAGRWVDADGLVFMRFVNNHKDFIIEEQENKVYYKITIGIDFGGNGSQTTFCAAGIKGHYKELNILKEYQIPLSTNIDADIICNEFLKFYREIEEEYGRVDHVFCDSASPTLINSLRTTAKKNDIRHGNIVGVKKNEVKERPPAIDLLMSQQRFFINEDCKQTIKSLGALKWDEKKPEIPEDKNIGNINDIFDAMCYTFIEFLPYFIRN